MTFQKNAGAARRYTKAMKFGAWLQSLPNRLVPAPFRLIQIGSAYWQSRALYVAARLDVAGALGGDSVPIDALAKRVDANADALGRLMRLLVAHGVFDEIELMVFRNNKLSHCLRQDDKASVRAMVLMHNDEVMSRPWFEQLEAGIRTGQPPFRLCHGEALFDYLDHHPEFDQRFSQAMDNVEALAGDGFATDFNWARFERVIDVGGSRGAKALAIIRRHPGMSALVVDRPQVVMEATRYWAAHPVPGSDRLRFQEGDVFAAVPAAAGAQDIFLLSAVLHAFDDARCVDALTVLRRAVGRSGARVAILEMIVPAHGADVTSATVDMQMFMASRGRERTLAQWAALVTASGLALEEVVSLRSLGSLLLLRAPRP